MLHLQQCEQESVAHNRLELYTPLFVRAHALIFTFTLSLAGAYRSLSARLPSLSTPNRVTPHAGSRRKQTLLVDLSPRMAARRALKFRLLRHHQRYVTLFLPASVCVSGLCIWSLHLSSFFLAFSFFIFLSLLSLSFSFFLSLSLC